VSRQLGVDGYLGLHLFTNFVLTERDDRIRRPPSPYAATLAVVLIVASSQSR
jgi:hypothetical protein